MSSAAAADPAMLESGRNGAGWNENPVLSADGAAGDDDAGAAEAHLEETLRANDAERRRALYKKSALGVGTLLVVVGVISAVVLLSSKGSTTYNVPHTMAADFEATAQSGRDQDNIEYTGKLYKTQKDDGSWDVAMTATFETDVERTTLTILDSRAYIQTVAVGNNQVAMSGCVSPLDVPPVESFGDSFEAATGVDAEHADAFRTAGCPDQDLLVFQWAGRTFSFCDMSAAGTTVLHFAGDAVEARLFNVETGSSSEDVANTITIPMDHETDAPLSCPKLDLADHMDALFDPPADDAVVAPPERRSLDDQDYYYPEDFMVKCVFLAGVEVCRDVDFAERFSEDLAGCDYIITVPLSTEERYDSARNLNNFCSAIHDSSPELMNVLFTYGSGAAVADKAFIDGVCGTETLDYWIHMTEPALPPEDEMCSGGLGPLRAAYTGMCDCDENYECAPTEAAKSVAESQEELRRESRARALSEARRAQDLSQLVGCAIHANIEVGLPFAGICDVLFYAPPERHLQGYNNYYNNNGGDGYSSSSTESLSFSATFSTGSFSVASTAHARRWNNPRHDAGGAGVGERRMQEVGEDYVQSVTEFADVGAYAQLYEMDGKIRVATTANAADMAGMSGDSRSWGLPSVLPGANWAREAGDDYYRDAAGPRMRGRTLHPHPIVGEMQAYTTDTLPPVSSYPYYMGMTDATARRRTQSYYNSGAWSMQAGGSPPPYLSSEPYGTGELRASVSPIASTGYANTSPVSILNVCMSIGQYAFMSK